MINLDELDYLDYQIVQWYESLPQHLRLNQRQTQQQTHSQNLTYLQAILFVRKSHLRNLVYRPILQSSSRIEQSHRHSQQGVQIAKESIQVLGELTSHTLLIQKYALFFKHLVLTSFGNLLLAVVNAAPLLWDSVRTEFDAALDLIRLLSAKSAPLQRLWQRLEGLRDLQAELSRASDLVTFHDCDPEGSNHSPNGLSLEDLFPSEFHGTDPKEQNKSFNLIAGDAEIREHFNNLFDVSGGFDTLFDLHDAGWNASA